MKDLLEGLGKLLVEFSFRRLLGFIVLLLLLAGGLAVYERLTSAFRLGRIERIASLTDRLRRLDSASLVDPALREVQNRMKHELQLAARRTPPALQIPTFGPPSVGVAVKRFLSGAAIWILIAFALSHQVERIRRQEALESQGKPLPRGERRSHIALSDAEQAVQQAGAVSLVSGVISIFLPLPNPWWFLVFAYPLVVLIAGIGSLGLFDLVGRWSKHGAQPASPTAGNHPA